MKKAIVILITGLLVIGFYTKNKLDKQLLENGVNIAAEVVETNGDVIRMDISAVRDGNSIAGVTYEVTDDQKVIVHISQEFRHPEWKESQQLQLLMVDMNEVSFMINDRLIDRKLMRQYNIWTVE